MGLARQRRVLVYSLMPRFKGLRGRRNCFSDGAASSCCAQLPPSGQAAELAVVRFQILQSVVDLLPALPWNEMPLPSNLRPYVLVFNAALIRLSNVRRSLSLTREVGAFFARGSLVA